jgi:uncharacterized protein (UPF0548 family)
MFTFRQPPRRRIERFLDAQRDQPYSYAAVGASRTQPPSGYTIDHNRIRLGAGAATFAQAVAALRRWDMFRLGWVQLCWPAEPLAVGTTVGVLAYAFGLWSLNACRIVYLTEHDGPIQRYGFAYGTLPGHVERGEERFTVEWHHDDDSVWYDLLAFSQPNHLLARTGYPLVRALQKRFARDSKQAMLRGVKRDA